eukprot:TRINITY_DN17258_c0_g1::TRINITY_DN17258_c0_g1_i1::g.7669::m.7669 TRINITY_DN17258_c0_g1::TRINITY_DN17258_c0_g1_i1::g.7669  ORF type:complete len:196 (+),score=36.51,sp/Q4KLT6/FL2D_XENLA/36.13/6e-21,Spc7/PF08317.6/0.0043,Spc7/PF08317.6/0.39,bZIP_1/PF00170.16/1.7e+03,bZIP_1/PF00170.16/8.8e+02,bZIP_1/PF00170.16/8.9e+02,bZIP_1/PF00170.16/0.00016,HOOK/PF05622.7/0.0008,GLE1/PF07817.8/1.5,GLE1/PF07817.8/0.65,Mnd1/PF03962.10/3.7,Mnd1/PF03962.10/0.1,AAA_13/PF13166.1/0.94,AAA_13/PF13166.1/0.37,TPR_MLP1_2/PF
MSRLNVDDLLAENERWKSILGFDDPDSAANSLENLRSSLRKTQSLLADSKKRENILTMRLTAKEQEIRDLQNQITDLHESLRPKFGIPRTILLDPAVNLEFNRLREALSATEAKLNEANGKLEVAKFTPQSVNGQKLMEKVKKLHSENKDIYKEIQEYKTLVEKLKMDAENTDELVKQHQGSNHFSLSFISSGQK